MNEGELKLEADVYVLLEDVKSGDFHDFKSSHATPKMYLVQRLQALIENAKEGRYDN